MAGADPDGPKTKRPHRGRRCILLTLAVVLAGSVAATAPLADAERAFVAFRSADDRARFRPSACRDRRRRSLADRSLALLDRVDASRLSHDDRRAAETMRHALAPAAGAPDSLTRSVYEAFGRAAEAIPFEGEILDRLTILARLASEQEEARRRRLFAALAPVWASFAGRPGESAPYAALVMRRREAWSKQSDGSPFDKTAKDWGLTPSELESWLTRVLQAWHDHALGGSPVEPWDWYFVHGAADRALASRLPRDAMIAAATRYYVDLGAEPDRLGITLDLAPRRGKDPVTFTDFLRHGRYERGVWSPGRFWVSASYRTGGLGNLYELMHELGHGVHIAAIRARPAFGDWPDSDVLTEALADVLGAEAYEPAWQRRYVLAQATPSDAVRSRLAGTLLDVAWALFEIRVHRDASADPSAVWAEITSRYLGIAPHPELPWWAMRGQLVDAPGYMLNYALGAIITEALRMRVRELRGVDAFEAPAPGLYGWLSESLYRYGLLQPSRSLVEDFLGRVLTPEPFLDTISRTRTAE